jgi:penicillin amidase
LTAPVKARFDNAGILHLTCQTDGDCIAAQGYFHGANRFLQMDLNRRFPQGRLGERVGSFAREFDQGNRMIIATQTGERIEERMLEAADEPTRLALDAYTRGVNAWLGDMRAERNDAKLSEEYDYPVIHKDTIDDWVQTDSLVCTLLLVKSLTDTSGQELRWGALTEALPLDIGQDLLNMEPAYHASILPHEPMSQKALLPTGWWQRQHVDTEALMRTAQHAIPISIFSDGASTGSNNWVVSPARSADGVALFSNDPHLRLNNPPYWYLIHLDSKTEGTGTLNVMGASFPGLPGVVIGRNEHIAWGMTTTYFDATDVYLETLSPDGTGVMYNGDVIPFLERTFEFKYADVPTETYVAKYVPHHGPVLAIDEEAGTALSMRWTGQDTDTDANYLMAIARASSVDEAQVALKNLTAIGQNVVVADVDGNIGWFPYNRLPQRPWASIYPPWLPIPGTGEAEWGPWIDYDRLPQSKNPEAGYIATANNDMTGASFDGNPTNDGHDTIQVFLAPGYRAGRIAQRLEASTNHNLATMESILADTHSLFGEDVRSTLLREVDTALSEAGRQAYDALMAWQFGCPTGLDGLDSQTAAPVADAVQIRESVGCTVFHALIGRVVDSAFTDELTAADVQWQPGMKPLARLLNRPESMTYGQQFWDDVTTEEETESRVTIVTRALNETGDWLRENLGPNTDDWLWGRIHQVTLLAPLFSDAGINDFNYGPFANDGGLYTVDVANPVGMQEQKYIQTAGPSMRFTCAMTRPPNCTIQLPGGQRHLRADPAYSNFLPGWLTNTSVPLNLDVSLNDDDDDEGRALTLTPTPQ